VSTIPDPVHAAALARPDAPAVIHSSGVLTYAALDARVVATSKALRAAGLAPGDRLAFYLPQDLRLIVLLLAAWRAGVVAAPLSTRQPVATIPALLERIGAAALVGEGGLDPDALTHGAVDPDGAPDRELDLVATILFTSGSTGVPRAAVHTLGNHVWSARGWAERMPLGRDDRWLLDLPLYHVGGLAVLVRCILAGAAVVLPEGGMPLAETLERHGVTHASLVATQLRRGLAGDTSTLGRLRLLLLGGSAIPADLLAEAHARGLPVATSYGLTEMASTVTATAPGASVEVLATAGAVLPYRELRLAADSEIEVRGRTRFAGYLTPDGIEEPFDAGGWFATGDLGAWTETGGHQMLRVVGRKDNLFISGGENIQPEAIEAALLALPGVWQAVVVPVDSEEYGERPAAFVEADAWEPQAWREALARTLPRFMAPETFHPWPEEAEGFKPDRSRLRQIAAQRKQMQTPRTLQEEGGRG
jgi:o-succinylbenzoate---CoA ligase